LISLLGLLLFEVLLQSPAHGVGHRRVGLFGVLAQLLQRWGWYKELSSLHDFPKALR